MDARAGARAALVFVAAAVALGVLYVRLPVLPDGDAYYHLAVARAYAERGLLHRLDWARFSIMHDAFGDKELLFHLLLVPFAVLFDPTTGGFIALALLGALIAATLAGESVAAIGPWGVAIPLLVFGGSADFLLRAIRLRPELLSLFFILIAIPLATRRRAGRLGVVAAAYTLSYTAFHAFLGLCVLFFLYGAWVERRRDWGLVVWPALGVALALGLHPDFPANVRIWAVQNLGFYFGNETVPSAENVSRTTRDTLILNLGWWAGLLVLWRSRVPSASPRDGRRAYDLTLLATAVFGILYLLVYRFVTYAVPLLTLAVVRAMQAAGTEPGRVTRLPRRGGVPFAPAFVLCLLAAIPLSSYGLGRMKAVLRSWRPDMRADWEAFARAVPAGAKIAAPWAASEAFVFWAPQAVYLDLLDPIFMAARDVPTYRVYVDLFEGRVPDLPLVAATRFDSEYYADDGQYPFARARLVADPRVAPVYEGITYLYRFLPGRNGDFLLDWNVLPADAPLPPPPGLADDPALRSYPRRTGRERDLEGYVDAGRLGPVSGCVAFVRSEAVERPTTLVLEISPYGTADVFVDDRLAAAILSPRAAVLGRGVVLPLGLGPGRHRVAIRTCEAEGQLGFYALVRRRDPAS